MARYATQPLGGGTYGLYDQAQGKFIETWTGRGARQKAERKWRQIVGAE
jgi:hypothetical protein